MCDMIKKRSNKVVWILLLFIAGICLILVVGRSVYVKVNHIGDEGPVRKEIIPKGTVLCDAAFASELIPVKRSSPVGPVVVLKSAGDAQGEGPDYVLRDGGTYDKHLVFHNTTLKPQEVQAIACVRDVHGPTVYYDNGYSDNSANWDVRLVRWPDGKILETHLFEGDTPPSSINTETGWNRHPPEKEFASWLESLLK
jgi:hypothetical protein